ncbi:MAG TPA: hypothetical protein VMU04_08100 [Candidatus Acidoferrum sp.]|nr:hypothetical protein [Candidatus Acidoferrum sp.]
MSDEIEQHVREELQQLLDESPQLAPTQFIDGDKLTTVAVCDGVPQIAKSELPATTRFACPSLAQLHGTPVCRIYNLMQSLRRLNEERQQEAAAQILSQTAVEEVDGVKMEAPQLPPSPEVINSTIGGETDLRTKPNGHGMFQNLQALQQRFHQLLAQHPELDPLVLGTPKGSVEIRVAGQRLSLNPTPLPGHPYSEVHQTPQVRLYLLHKTIQGLEAALCGKAAEIEVTRPGRRHRAAEKLAQHLGQMKCGNLVVPVRRSRKNLFVGGPAREIIYPPMKVRLTPQGALAEEEAQQEPLGHTRVEYGALLPEVKALLSAFFAYLSSKVSNESRCH